MGKLIVFIWLTSIFSSTPQMTKKLDLTLPEIQSVRAEADCVDISLAASSNQVRKKVLPVLNVLVVNNCQEEIFVSPELTFLLNKSGVDLSDPDQLKFGNHLRTVEKSNYDPGDTVSFKKLEQAGSAKFSLNINELEWIDTMASNLLTDPKTSRIVGENIWKMKIKKGRFLISSQITVRHSHNETEKVLSNTVELKIE